MHQLKPWLMITGLLSLYIAASGQTTEDYFSRQGLSLNAYHWNFYDGLYSTSYTFYKKDTFCNEGILVFVNNQDGYMQHLRIEGSKVYVVYASCDHELLYDFGLTAGEEVPEGIYAGWTVLSVDDVALENGDIRKQIDLEHNFGYGTSWIEGIGDIQYGLIPFFADFEGGDVFVCAKEGDEMLWTNPEQADTCAKYSCVKPVVSLQYTVDGFEISIDNQSIFANTYQWDFGDGEVSTEASPVHTYAGPGCYIVTLKAFSDCYTEGVEYLQNTPVCIDDPWLVNYTIDTFFSLRVYRYSDSLEFIYNNDELYKTTDGGMSWLELNVPEVPVGVRRHINDLKMFDEMRGIMVCGHYDAESDQTAILVTGDGGLTWEEKVPGSYYMLRVELAPDGRAWALGQWEYHRSFDYGATWESIDHPLGFEVYSIQFIHDSLLIGKSFTGLQPNGTYHLVKSTDDGLTWEKINLPISVRDWYFFDADHGYGFRDGYGMSITSDGGLTWTEMPLPFTVKAFAFYSTDAGWLLDNTGLVHYTQDGLQTFSISNCGRTILNRITPVSASEAFAIAGKPLGSSSTGKSKVTFDQSTVVGCTALDEDGDGYPALEDCNDTNPDVNPGEVEVPYNGLDDDCDTLTPDDDLDQDGYTLSEDCDDQSPGIYPGAPEIANNGIDEDCDGIDLITSVTDPENVGISIYPNPASGILYIHSALPMAYQWSLFSPEGRVLRKGAGNHEVDITSMSSGLYLLEVMLPSTGQKAVKKVVVQR